MTIPDLQFIFVLLIVFQIKHLIGDFVLQTGWMVRGKSLPGAGFVFPLSIHVLVHAVMTFGIVMLVDRNLWYLAILDFAVHFIMDRVKAGPNMLGRYNDVSKSSYWIPFGIDQMVHHLTHYGIIWILILHRL